MKRLLALLASTVISGTMLASLSTNAADSSDYMPTLYFEADQNDNIEVLKSGSIFINTSKLTADELTLNAKVYIDDSSTTAGLVKVKWHSASEYIKLSSATDPITLTGFAPYAEFTNPSSILVSTNTQENFQSVLYSTGLSTDPMKFTGNASDDYPLAGFEAIINTAIPAGKYEIAFTTGQRGNGCDILYRPNDIDIVEVFPEGKYTKSLNIAVSDRLLGDVNKSGKIDASDASKVLAEYAELSSGENGSFTAAESAAADTNGDGLVSAIDASNILSYYAYLSAEGTLSLVEYLG